MKWELTITDEGLSIYTYRGKAKVVVDEINCTLEVWLFNQRKNYIEMEPHFRHRIVTNNLRSVANSIDNLLTV